MVNVEIRKVQRLGASSLVITLPHTWVKKVNLKPGDNIMVLDEGMSLKLIPISKTSNPKSSVVNLKSLKDGRVLNLVIPCFYVLGYDEVSIKLYERDPEILSYLKSATLKLPGLEIVDLGGDIITAKILLDPSKVDLKTLMKSMTVLTSNVVKVVAKGIKSGFSQDLEQEVKYLSEDLYRLRSIVERQLHLYQGAFYEGEGLNQILALISLTLLGLMNVLLLDVIDIIRWNISINVELSNALDKLGNLVPLIGSIVANPSIKRSMEILEALQAIQRDVVNLIKSRTLEDLQYVIATRIADFVKILQIICYAVTCFGLSRGEES